MLFLSAVLNYFDLDNSLKILRLLLDFKKIKNKCFLNFLKCQISLDVIGISTRVAPLKTGGEHWKIQ